MALKLLVLLALFAACDSAARGAVRGQKHGASRSRGHPAAAARKQHPSSGQAGGIASRQDFSGIMGYPEEAMGTFFGGGSGSGSNFLNPLGMFSGLAGSSGPSGSSGSGSESSGSGSSGGGSGMSSIMGMPQEVMNGFFGESGEGGFPFNNFRIPFGGSSSGSGSSGGSGGSGGSDGSGGSGGSDGSGGSGGSDASGGSGGSSGSIGSSGSSESGRSGGSNFQQYADSAGQILGGQRPQGSSSSGGQSDLVSLCKQACEFEEPFFERKGAAHGHGVRRGGRSQRAAGQQSRQAFVCPSICNGVLGGSSTGIFGESGGSGSGSGGSSVVSAVV